MVFFVYILLGILRGFKSLAWYFISVEISCHFIFKYFLTSFSFFISFGFWLHWCRQCSHVPYVSCFLKYFIYFLFFSCFRLFTIVLFSRIWILYSAISYLVLNPFEFFISVILFFTYEVLICFLSLHYNPLFRFSKILIVLQLISIAFFLYFGQLLLHLGMLDNHWLNAGHCLWRL